MNKNYRNFTFYKSGLKEMYDIICNMRKRCTEFSMETKTVREQCAINNLWRLEVCIMYEDAFYSSFERIDKSILNERYSKYLYPLKNMVDKEEILEHLDIIFGARHESHLRDYILFIYIDIKEISIIEKTETYYPDIEPYLEECRLAPHTIKEWRDILFDDDYASFDLNDYVLLAPTGTKNGFVVRHIDQEKQRRYRRYNDVEQYMRDLGRIKPNSKFAKYKRIELLEQEEQEIQKITRWLQIIGYCKNVSKSAGQISNVEGSCLTKH